MSRPRRSRGSRRRDAPRADHRAAPGLLGWIGRTRRRTSRSARENKPLALLIALLTVVSLTIGIILGIRQLLPDPEPPRHSVLILVDTSRSMKQRFGADRTKLEAVRAQVLDYARNRPDSAIALRFTGGACSDGYSEPPVAFGRKNTDEIVRSLATARLGGRSDFSSGLSQAVNDFDRFEAGRSAQVQSIWVFLGSGRDECRSDPYRAIENALEGFDYGVKFDFFGLGASRAEARALRALVRRLRRDEYEAYVNTPRNVSQLRKAVEETSQRETPSP